MINTNITDNGSMNVEQILNGYYTQVCDIKETSDCTLVYIELPGVNNCDINIEIGEGALNV